MILIVVSALRSEMTTIDWDLLREREKNIPEAVRNAVKERDNYRCRRCGREDGLSLHHLKKRSDLGLHTKDNLVTVCMIPCHMLLEEHKINVKLINGHFYFSG